MKRRLIATVIGLAFVLASGMATAGSELNFFIWGNYTSPELVEKLEKETGIKLTITDFSDQDSALAKVKAGGHGFDMILVGSDAFPIWVGQDLLLESRPDQMSNFKNLESLWLDVNFDPGRHYSVPWAWGTSGIIVNTAIYDGDINTSSIIFDPPPELVGKVNVSPEMGVVMGMVLYYIGSEPCTDDKAMLKKARDVLMAAHPKWLGMQFGNIEQLIAGDMAASLQFNGEAYRVRQENPTVRYGYPKEGYSLWMDSVAILKDAKNVENAKTFLNFLMDPENAALVSTFSGYANGIKGSAKYMPEEMLSAPELVIPAEFVDAGHFLPTCSPEVYKLYTAIWTELQK